MPHGPALANPSVVRGLVVGRFNRSVIVDDDEVDRTESFNSSTCLDAPCGQVPGVEVGDEDGSGHSLGLAGICAFQADAMDRHESPLLKSLVASKLRRASGPVSA